MEIPNGMRFTMFIGFEIRERKKTITKYSRPSLKLSIRATSSRKNSFQPLGDHRSKPITRSKISEISQ